jgi:hypothetical protein
VFRYCVEPVVIDVRGLINLNDSIFGTTEVFVITGLVISEHVGCAIIMF